jgi:hypothetical protein
VLVRGMSSQVGLLYRKDPPHVLPPRPFSFAFRASLSLLEKIGPLSQGAIPHNPLCLKLSFSERMEFCIKSPAKALS